MKPIIMLDMDGVLADFEGWSFKTFGPSWKSEIDKENWGRFAEHPDLYALLEPFDDAKLLYEGCVEATGDKNLVQCLTALPNRARAAFPDAARHKIEWARKYINPDLRVHFGPFAKDKQYHKQHPDDILIDDMYINIKQWRKVGGIGIEHKNAKQTLDELNHYINVLKNRGR
jgi:hypothetical protein